MPNKNIHGRQVSRMVASGSALALSLGLGVGRAGAQDPLFETGARSYRLDTGFECGDLRPIEHTTADLDGDGDLDLIHSYGQGDFCSQPPRFSVLLNNGDGTYAQPVFNMAFAGETRGIAAADFDGDGDVDLAFTQIDMTSGQSVLVFLNFGNGTFGSQQVYACSRAPSDIAAADFDHDGDVDLATVSSFVDESISVLYNNGSASFVTRVDYPLGTSGLFLEGGDLNGDGFADLVASGNFGQSEDVVVLLNDGTGGFGGAVNYEVPGLNNNLKRGFALGDLDEDGDLDVIYAGGSEVGFQSPVMIMFNNGDGTLATALPVATVPNFDRNRIAIADLTGDGHLDMAISGGVIGFDAWVSVAGDGAGGFGEASISWTCSTNIETGISTADVTGDGLPEVILTSPARIVRIHEGSGGSFDNLPVLYPVEGLTQRLDAGDIDLDGDLDVVTAFSSRIYRLLNSGDGTFVSTWQDAALGCMEAMALRDINGDGYPDLLMAKDPDCPPYHFYTALNNGDGTFGGITVWPIDSAGGNEFATLDWDNDGDLDVVISEMFSCPSCPSDRKWYLTNTGDGTFEPPVFTTGTSGLQMVTGDFNEDGNMDFAGRASPGAWVYLGNGDGSFTHAQYASTEPPNWIDVGDMNNDGHLDLVWTSWGADEGGRTGIMLGDGHGAFTQAGWRTGPFALGHDLEVLDADGDSNLDIVVSHPAAADLVVFRGNGAGMLLPQQRYGTDGAVYQPRVGDFDGDGRKDIAVIAQTHSGANVTVLRGLGGDVPLPGDVDGDGDVDMLDLLMLLVLWGPCPPQQACAADFDGDGLVGILDLLALLANWG